MTGMVFLFPMHDDINNVLLMHLSTAGGAAYELRNDKPTVRDAAMAFFAARTDIRRLDTAQTLAETILSRNDFHELNAIRDLVAKQELKRQIGYPHQRDHT